MKKLEEAISNLEMYRTNNSNYDEELANNIDTVLEALKNSISKDVIEKIENEEICYREEQFNNGIIKIITEESKKQVEAYKKHILEILKKED